MAEGKAYRIVVNEEQKEAIEIFCNSMEWDISFDLIDSEADSNPQSERAPTRQTSAAVVRQNPQPRPAEFHDIWTEESAEECAFCFLSPCVTTHRQTWLGAGKNPNLTNRVTRKTKYKKFWSLMDYRQAWNHPRYLHKKEAAMLEDDREERIVWCRGANARTSVREIMPECILKLVRGLYPNPPNVPYMSHKWH